jgi:hypothetical protein
MSNSTGGDVSNFDIKLECFFKLSFIMDKTVNLDAMLCECGYFKLYFIMTKVCNLDAMTIINDDDFSLPN